MKSPSRSVDPPNRFLPVLLLVAGVAAYSSSFEGVFILDDFVAIRDNASIRSLHTAFFPPPDSTVSGRPVLNLSLALNHAAGGLHPWGYHSVNLAIHLAASLLLFGIVRRTLLLPGWEDRYHGTASSLAVSLALLWLLHPVQTGSVTYIIQRAEILMGSFFLLTLYCAVRGFTSDRPARWFGAATAACLLGTGCKEVMVTAPILVLLYDRVFISPSLATALRRHRNLYLGLAACWLAMAFLILSGGRLRATGERVYEVTVWEYATTQSSVLLHYLRLVVWPHPLVLHHGWPLAHAFRDWALPAAALLLLVAGTLAAFLRFPGIGFLGAWFFLVLAPTSSIIPIPRETAAEHRMYLPLAAPLALLVLGLDAAFHRWSRDRWRRIGAPFLLAGAALVFGGYTWVRNQDYHSEKKMWRLVTTQRQDNPAGHNNLGLIQFREGEIEAAQASFQRAVSLQPLDPDLLSNLGMALATRAQNMQAAAVFRKALAIRPMHFNANYNLGFMLSRAGKPGAAETHYERAHAVRPDHIQTTDGLVNVLSRLGKHEKAVQVLKKMARNRPDHAGFQYRLGILLVMQNRVAEAVVHLRASLRLEAGQPQARIALGWILAAHPDPTHRNPKEALELTSSWARFTGASAVRLADVHAAALAAGGDFKQAALVAGKAAQLAGQLGESRLAAAIHARVQTYRAGRPLRAIPPR